MAARAGRQVFFVHAGLPKTGTSYLQDIVFGSRAELREQGLELLPRRRHGHFDLALKVRGLLQPFDGPDAEGVLDRFAGQVARNTAPRALLTQEALAAATPEAVASLLRPLEAYDVHLVVTARDLGRQVPSAWQQAVKGRRTTGYEDFLQAVVHRGDPARDFWRNQGLTEVLERWSTGIAAERIHVITCPRPGAPKDLLLKRFCSVIGVDHAGLRDDAVTQNLSLGQPQAELLRRVNLALGDRLPHSRAGYRRVARSFLSDRLLEPQRGPRPRLPESMRGWVEEVTATWVDRLASGGYDVVGDIDELRADDSAYTPELRTASDSELLEVAVAALADILEIRDRELDERTELRERADRLARQLGEREQSDGGRTPAMLARRLRRRPRD